MRDEEQAASSSWQETPTLGAIQASRGPALRLLILRDDRAREFPCTAGGEGALQRAKDNGWTVISVKND